MESVLNPYEFLGLSTTNATLAELKTAYYRLALLCHPDKGGEASAMATLTLAYQWVLRELTGVKDHLTSFKEFYGEHIQTTPVRGFTDVLAESFDYTPVRFAGLCESYGITVPALHQMLYVPAFEWAMRQFATPETLDTHLHAFLENYQKDTATPATSNMEYYVPMSDPVGYGELLEQPDLHQTDYTKPLVVYQEPLCPDRPLAAGFLNPADATTLGGFTSLTEPLPVYDYQEAFTSNVFPALDDASGTPMSVEQKQLERQMQDQNLTGL